MRNIKIKKSTELSTYGNPRYVILDVDTDEIIDTAQGYGYKSPQKARAAFAYKNRTPEQKKKEKVLKKLVRDWCKENKAFIRKLECMLEDEMHQPDFKLTEKYIENLWKEDELSVQFTGKEFLRYW